MKRNFPLKKLSLWNDGEPRSGPENMAVDQWIAETSREPVLRVYRWQGDWASLGYFSRIEEARRVFPDCPLVRRWTGGGMVDHRNDWTYTLFLPADQPLAQLRGNKVYSVIHRALLQVMMEHGIDARLAASDDSGSSPLCFERPVCMDVVDADGIKLAGAGQRRGRYGLLHQGSVSLVPGDDTVRASSLASALAEQVDDCEMCTDPWRIAELLERRYGQEAWLNLR